MGKIYSFDGVIPVIHPDTFVHPEAVIIGDVVIGTGCYIGPCASLRGDFGQIVVGDGANIQDSCTLHSFPGKGVIVEDEGHVGHGSILHGCIVGRKALVGMNAVVMDGAEIGEQAFIGANAFLKAGFIVPPKHLVAGNPGKIIRELKEEEMNWKAAGTKIYQSLAIRSKSSLKRVEPLTELDEDRGKVSWDEEFLKPLLETRK
ncbi:MAG: transferase hexapeptide repeat family protein [Desulfobacterales bacterium]|nr:transferase hexapeptide repeat family protein [Desulfobacterales bacterium]MCP4163028.1 transferase hexapeptide repeat family protein [Deltaproteobacteria bacterium]